MSTDLRRAETSIDISTYTFDGHFLGPIDSSRMNTDNKVKVRILMDASNVAKPSPKQQSSALLRLVEFKIAHKKRTPKNAPDSAFPLHHVKQCVLDGELAYHGSMNFTKNSALYCTESMIRSREVGTIER